MTNKNPALSHLKSNLRNHIYTKTLPSSSDINLTDYFIDVAGTHINMGVSDGIVNLHTFMISPGDIDDVADSMVMSVASSLIAQNSNYDAVKLKLCRLYLSKYTIDIYNTSELDQKAWCFARHIKHRMYTTTVVNQHNFTAEYINQLCIIHPDEFVNIIQQVIEDIEVS